ncbi:MAG: hypothetical protein OEO23_01765 [Gemmatimonadota bacterium]|nr:hypothetical protein [Gemmatimonadota bacterium]
MRKTRIPRPVVVVASLLAIAACGTDDLLGPEALQGIEGLVLIGPQCPVQTLEDPCPDLPYEAAIDIRNRAGDVVVRARSGQDGMFRVGLRPGVYTLVPLSGDPFPVAQAQEVEVPRGEYAEVIISFDTGIR